MAIADELNTAIRRLSEAGVEAPLLDAQLLLAHVLDIPRLEVIAHTERALSENEVAAFRALVDQRARRCPLAYLLGYREFYGLRIAVSEAVLVPRPETELLVEECLRRVKTDAPVVADVGTGTGAVAVAIATRLPHAQVYATDISHAALEVARQNVANHQLANRVILLEGDLTGPLAGMSLDAVVSNPPYIPTGEIERLAPEISRWEPRSALDGGTDGLDAYRRLLPAARGLLYEVGFAAVEVGENQAARVMGIAQAAGYSEVQSARDLAGTERVVVAYAPSPLVGEGWGGK